MLRIGGPFPYLLGVTTIRILVQSEPLRRLFDADTTRDSLLHCQHKASLFADCEVLVGKSEEGDLRHGANSMRISASASPRCTPRRYRSVDLRARSTPRATARARRGCPQQICVFSLESRHRVLVKMPRNRWWPRGGYSPVVVRWRRHGVSVIIPVGDSSRAALGALGGRRTGRSREHEVYTVYQ